MLRTPAAAGIPARFDLHLLAGRAALYGVPAAAAGSAFAFDLDARALVAKRHVRRRIPRKYRHLFGDELYVGHVLVPRTFLFARSRSRDAWLYYMDWTPVGLKLFNRPAVHTNRARASFKAALNAVCAYQAFREGKTIHHALRPGIAVRMTCKLQLARFLSLEAAVFRKLLWSAYASVDGERRNVMAQPGGVCAGLVLQVPGQVRR